MIPSLPFLETASIYEVLWVFASLVSFWLAVGSWRCASAPRYRLKAAIRVAISVVFVIDGVLAAFTPGVPRPTLLSVMNPLAFVFGATGMAMLAVIDEQHDIGG